MTIARIERVEDLDEHRWRSYVEEGQKLAAADRGGAAFELGDLALAVEPVGKEGIKTGGLERLRKYAYEIGVPFNTLRTYRDVATAWPAPNRLGAASFKAHAALASEPDRAELIRAGYTTSADIAALKAERHPKVGIKRDEKWWAAEQESLKHLRTWSEKRIEGLSLAELRHRAAVMRELIRREEEIAETLEIKGTKPPRL